MSRISSKSRFGIVVVTVRARMENDAFSHGATQIGIPQSVAQVFAHQYYNVSDEHIVSKRSP